MAKPRTPHLHCAARAVLQAASPQCAGSRGKSPRPFLLGGIRGDVLFPRKENIPPCPAAAQRAALTMQRQRRCNPSSPAKEENQKGIPSSKREYPPLSGSSAKSCTNSCSADGAATTHPPRRGIKRGNLFGKRTSPFVWQQRKELHELMQRRWRCNPPSPTREIKRDTLFRKRVSPLICPFRAARTFPFPAPVQDYFLKLSFSVTDRLNTRCSGVQSLLSRQK